MPLLIIFSSIGILLIIAGIGVLVRMYRSSAVVDAECIEVRSEAVAVGAFPRTYYRDAKTPVYRYRYEGREYVGSPFLQSNRPGFHPQLGPCKVRISRKNPEKVFSSERKPVAVLLIGMGILYLIAVAVAAMVAPL